MPEQLDQPVPRVSAAPPAAPAASAAAAPAEAALTDRLRETPGLTALVAEAEATWRARADAAGEASGAKPGWRTFEDAFPTFYEFTNRPR